MGTASEERRETVRRLADRELHELIQDKLGVTPGVLVHQRKKRRAIRHTCKATLKVDVMHSSDPNYKPELDQVELRGRILDLSEGGTSVFTKYDIPTGYKLTINLTIYDGSIIEAIGMVRWSKPKEAKKGYALGIEFVDLNSKTEKRLNAFLTELDATLGM